MRDLIPPEPGSPCPCGSDLPCRPLMDACDTWCAAVCDACEAIERSHWNPAIFDRRTYPRELDIPFPRSDTPWTDDREDGR